MRSTPDQGRSLDSRLTLNQYVMLTRAASMMKLVQRVDTARSQAFIAMDMLAQGSPSGVKLPFQAVFQEDNVHPSHLHLRSHFSCTKAGREPGASLAKRGT